MILLNFSHPITDDQLAQLTAVLGNPVDEVRHIPTQFDPDQHFAPQAITLVDGVGLSPTQWQTERILVNPPSLAIIATAVLAELHGRMGYFPTVIRLRPVPGNTPPVYEVAEVINLQSIRDSARGRR